MFYCDSIDSASFTPRYRRLVATPWKVPVKNYGKRRLRRTRKRSKLFTTLSRAIEMDKSTGYC